MKDIIEVNKMSYDEKYNLLRRAGKLELRRKTYGVKYYTIIAGSDGMAFLTRFFANRRFDWLVKRHNLKEDHIWHGKEGI